MADRQGKELLAPAAAEGMDIGPANPAALDLDVDVIVAERLGIELVLVNSSHVSGPLTWKPVNLSGYGIFGAEQEQIDLDSSVDEGRKKEEKSPASTGWRISCARKYARQLFLLPHSRFIAGQGGGGGRGPDGKP